MPRGSLGLESRRPMASRPGQKRRASRSSTMTTGGAVAASRLSKYLPLTSGMCIASKYPSLAVIRCGATTDSPDLGSLSSVRTTLLL